MRVTSRFTSATSMAANSSGSCTGTPDAALARERVRKAFRKAPPARPVRSWQWLAESRPCEWIEVVEGAAR